ncbi:hypothetical protein DYY66_2452 [Candidatus Nitrosotalea sp. FS]|nr:hypothetical protein [Candidatus Nitrosotalea sp. FS]
MTGCLFLSEKIIAYLSCKKKQHTNYFQNLILDIAYIIH